MQSVFDRIVKLRNGAPFIIDRHNSNRYRFVVYENDGSKTAYYFSAPIYHHKSRKLVDLQFHRSEDGFCTAGSNADITISQNITLENAVGFCVLDLPQKPVLLSSREICCGSNTLMPTTNGIAMKCRINEREKVSLTATVSNPFLNVMANDKCLAFMQEQFTPFVVFSCIGSVDGTGNVIAPAQLEYQKLTDKKYQLTISSTSPQAQFVLLECNLYENKLFQDTTVESMHPASNNAFGSVGFIGHTSLCGEQWLYSRLDHTRMPELMDRCIHKAVLHIPKLNRNNTELCVFNVASRFCSFGSNWDNKIADSAWIADSVSNGRYQSLDLTTLLVDQRTGNLKRSEGFILKPKHRQAEFSAITTADSSFAPQILEIQFR